MYSNESKDTRSVLKPEIIYSPNYSIKLRPALVYLFCTLVRNSEIFKKDTFFNKMVFNCLKASSDIFKIVLLIFCKN